MLDGVRSIVMLAMNYRTAEPAPPQPGQGRVSRYAWGDADYHDLIRERLNALADSLRERVPAAQVRGVVDTAPLLEREFAQLAGLGWIGKNTLLLNRARGQLVLPGRAADGRRAGLRPAARDRSLRHVPGVSRCLPDRRVSAAVRARRLAVHQLS